jgi:hypothetical protein
VTAYLTLVVFPILIRERYCAFHPPDDLVVDVVYDSRTIRYLAPSLVWRDT